jgi:hypothetical protein
LTAAPPSQQFLRDVRRRFRHRERVVYHAGRRV